MRKELKNDYYDEAYKGAEKYEVHYTKSPYYEIWKYITSIIDKGSDVLDLGCGTGQFAEMLVDNDINLSYGVDFSETAIDMANNLFNGKFYKADLYDTSTYDKHFYDNVVCLEVLEHVEYDLKVLSNIKKGSKIIITVPNYDSLGHVRFFKNMEEVRGRFCNSFNITHEKTFNVTDAGKKIFLLQGII